MLSCPIPTQGVWGSEGFARQSKVTQLVLRAARKETQPQESVVVRGFFAPSFSRLHCSL